MLMSCFDKFLFFTGIFVILLALCADAVIGNVQEKVMKQFNCSNIEMVSIKFFYINSFNWHYLYLLIVHTFSVLYENATTIMAQK